MIKTLENIKKKGSGYWECDLVDLNVLLYKLINEEDYEHTNPLEQLNEWDDRFDFWGFVGDFYVEIQPTTNNSATTVGESLWMITEKRRNDISSIDWEEYLLPGEEMPNE